MNEADPATGRHAGAAKGANEADPVTGEACRCHQGDERS